MNKVNEIMPKDVNCTGGEEEGDLHSGGWTFFAMNATTSACLLDLTSTAATTTTAHDDNGKLDLSRRPLCALYCKTSRITTANGSTPCTPSKLVQSVIYDVDKYFELTLCRCHENRFE